jgi:GTPase
MSEESDFRAGYATIVGRPNVGKSTLLNAVMGQKLAAVTNKPQTTRHRISGILTTDDTQYIFLDTPGIFAPKYRLQEHMVKSAYDAAKGADIVLFVIDAERAPHRADDELLARLPVHPLTYLVINKVDRIHKPLLLPVLEHYGATGRFTEMLPISAKRGDGVENLLATMRPHLPLNPHLFPEDQISDLPTRFFVAETVREKVFLRTRQEVPYASSVVIEEFVEDTGASRVFIRAAIYVERPTQKGIIIGKQGSMLRDIGTDARKDIEEFLGGPVFLELFVGVRESWRDNEQHIRDLGYGVQ